MGEEGEDPKRLFPCVKVSPHSPRWLYRSQRHQGEKLTHNFVSVHRLSLMIHGFQLANILLMDNMEPKLSDFGLARMVGMKETKCFTEVRGTIGYMDPEYMSHGNLSCASDIYSFGVVILQLLSGRKVIELDTKARETLTRKVATKLIVIPQKSQQDLHV